ncbi:hypothetical protein [Paraburkholderia sp. Ac-20347]|uniref:hypothetical protein n=1 Tax=Paraburkholderia sp. Ac-20347 TaxID=2703892 RepID=UPI00197F73FA|nr:hypothetical protein [Paraburkholderia sp. Ac-20347]MBN3808513.1 hypothetical protein [Paraburkholderia sp. Ac-20347]
MQLEDDELAEITRLLSGERLSTFVALAGSARGAVELHQETVRVASGLMAVTAVVEISLRNAICDQLVEHFNAPDWLRTPPKPFEWKPQESSKIGEACASAQQAAYAKLSAADKRALDARIFRNGVPAHFTHEQHVKARQKAIAVPTGQIVAQLSLFFWKRLFSADYEHVLWRPALKRVFPDKSLRRADVAVQLERIYQTRNRIAHHEPVYGGRLRDAIEAIEFVVGRLGRSAPQSRTPLGQLLAMEKDTLAKQASDLQIHIAAYSNGASPGT